MTKYIEDVRPITAAEVAERVSRNMTWWEMAKAFFNLRRLMLILFLSLYLLASIPWEVPPRLGAVLLLALFIATVWDIVSWRTVSVISASSCAFLFFASLSVLLLTTDLPRTWRGMDMAAGFALIALLCAAITFLRVFRLLKSSGGTGLSLDEEGNEI